MSRDEPVAVQSIFNHSAVQQILALPMLRLPSSKAQGCKDFQKPVKPCHVGINWIALTEYSQMSTHLAGFQSILGFWHILFGPN